jgi:hypothetical protein
MLCLEVSLNRTRLARAAFPVEGVLSCIVNGKRNPKTGDEFSFNLGGLDGSTDTFLDWAQGKLNPGDAVKVRLMDARNADEPTRRERAKDIGMDALGIARMEVAHLKKRLTEATRNLKRLEAKKRQGAGRKRR